MISSTRAVVRSLIKINNVIKNQNISSKSTWLTQNRFLSASSSCWGRKYSEQHEWVTVDGKVATIGLSHYAQDSLGEIVYAQLPEVGNKIEQYGEVGAIESVKSADEIYTPVSGTVVEINEAIEKSAAIINQSCYDEGWLFKVEMSESKELDKLLNEEEYKEFLKTSKH